MEIEINAVAVRVTIRDEYPEIATAVRNYFELEAACLIPGGEAWRPAMKEAEQHAVDLIARRGGVVQLGPLIVEAHEAFEGDKLLGRWLTFKGPMGHLSDAANTAAHTRLRVPWKRGLHIETAAYELGRAHGKRQSK